MIFSFFIASHYGKISYYILLYTLTFILEIYPSITYFVADFIKLHNKGQALMKEIFKVYRGMIVYGYYYLKITISFKNDTRNFALYTPLLAKRDMAILGISPGDNCLVRR